MLRIGLHDFDISFVLSYKVFHVELSFSVFQVCKKLYVYAAWNEKLKLLNVCFIAFQKAVYSMAVVLLSPFR
jgi:hypothetical protein